MPARRAVGKDDHQLDLFSARLPSYQTLESLRLPSRETWTPPKCPGETKEQVAPERERKKVGETGSKKDLDEASRPVPSPTAQIGADQA